MGYKLYIVVIVEDEKESAERLAEALKPYDEFYVAAIVPSMKKAVKAIEKFHPDLLFMDIELPDGKGFAMLDKLHPYITWPMRTVFYTAHDKYMLNAIRSEAFDYLLKPFDNEDLDNILKRFTNRKHKEENEERPNTLASVKAPSILTDNECFILQLPSGDIRVVKLTDIGFFHYNMERRGWEVLLYNQKWVPLRSSVKPDQIVNYSEAFIRTHQAYIINVSYLAMIHNDNCLLYPPFNHTDIPISNRYKKLLKQTFRQL